MLFYMTNRLRQKIVITVLLLSAACLAAEPQPIEIEVTESAGMRRHSSPVHTLIQLPKAVAAATKFRLLHNGKPVVAQFRPDQQASQTSKWWLDFMARVKPFETTKYRVEYGETIDAGPEAKSGHVLSTTNDVFLISHAPHIDWTVPRDLIGLLKSVDFRPNEHLRPDSLGLAIRDSGGKQHQLGGEGVKAQIVRQGKAAVALRFTKSESSAELRGVKWTVNLVFPGGISWVDVQLRIDDPHNHVAAAELELRLNLDPPTRKVRSLAEFGASRIIYRSLTGDTEFRLTADRRDPQPWQVFYGQTGQLETLSIAASKRDFAKGWAHIMDRKRCLALAVDNFGAEGAETLSLGGDGIVQAVKSFASPEGSIIIGPKKWRMWLHFVHFPQQQSANSDPFMMQNPLKVRQLDR